VPDDPIDAFDKFADDIRRRQDELDAADKLRSDKAEKRTKPQPEAPPSADVEPPESK
jgi:hypothetical protein